MAASFKKFSSELFNDEFLSDIKIKQVSNGQIRGYYAHKAVLCMESQYFMKAFKARFKESTEAVFELHDDDPNHFAFLLEYIYTHEYSAHAIEKSANEDPEKETLIAIAFAFNGITISATNDMLSVILEAHYGGSGGARTGSPLGTVITSAIVKHHNTYLGTPLFKDVLKAHPTFGADVALALVEPFKAVR